MIPTFLVSALLASTSSAYVAQVRSATGKSRIFQVRDGNTTAEEFLARREPVVFHSQNLGKRETPCIANPQTDHYYQIIGDGNPHQNYKIAQVENTIISCPGTVSTGESHTFGWSIGGGFNPGTDAYDFASLSFSVSESDTKTVTDAFTCDDDWQAKGQTEICALHYTAVTAVTVEFFSKTTSCNIETTQDNGQGVVYLPNANGYGSTIARGVNFGNQNIIQCRGTAAREVEDYCGPKGGSEYFDTNAVGPWQPPYISSTEPAGCAPPIEANHY